MRCAVIGQPAEHSLSPAIHRAGYAAHGLDWHYDAITVAPDDLDAFLGEQTADSTLRGLSVTAPHKEALLAWGEPDHVTRLVGAGNTLICGDTRHIYNTDVPGFVRAWRAHGLTGARSAAIIGNGATSRSLLVALAGLGTQRVTILARRPERARQVSDLGVALGIDMTVQPLDAHFDPVDVIASTIPAAGTADFAERWVDQADVVFDAVYDPWPTPLGEAASGDHVVLTGLDLLAGQAVDQFFLMTGETLAFDAAKQAAEEALAVRRASTT